MILTPKRETRSCPKPENAPQVRGRGNEGEEGGGGEEEGGGGKEKEVSGLKRFLKKKRSCFGSLKNKIAHVFREKKSSL